MNNRQDLDPFATDRYFDGQAPADLEAFFAALRQPALPHEIEAQGSVVEQMRRAIAEQSAASVRPAARTATRRLGKGAIAAAVAVLSLGGVAAAATGNNPLAPILATDDSPRLEAPKDSSTTTTSSTTSSSTTTRAASTTAPTTTRAEGTGVDDDTDDDSGKKPAGEVKCDDAKNHGDYVSSVARSGGDVVAAAKSDCGKKKSDDDDDDDDDNKPKRSSTTTRSGDDDDDDDGDRGSSTKSDKGKGDKGDDRKGSNKGKG